MNWDYLYFWRQSERRELEAQTPVAEPPHDGTAENACEFAALEYAEASEMKGAPAR